MADVIVIGGGSLSLYSALKNAGLGYVVAHLKKEEERQLRDIVLPADCNPFLLNPIRETAKLKRDLLKLERSLSEFKLIANRIGSGKYCFHPVHGEPCDHLWVNPSVIHDQLSVLPGYGQTSFYRKCFMQLKCFVNLRF